MKPQNSKGATKGSKNMKKNAAAKQQVTNPADNSPKRVVETRDAWTMIFNHSVALIAAYAKGIKVEKPREGFEEAFGSAATSPHSRAYAKSLIWGITTNKAAKVLKNLDELADKAIRVKIAMAILTDCKLVKGDDKLVESQLSKVETKREKAVAEAVLTELTKPEPTTPKGGKGKGKSQPKAEKPATKGGKTTTKGGKTSAKPAAPKGSKAKAAQPEAEEVVVYDYIHFDTPFGVITTPTTGYFETEQANAMKSLRTYLQSELAALTAKGSKQTAATTKRIKKIEDFLNANSAMQSCQLDNLGWSNEVTPKELGKKSQIVIVEKVAPKGAKANGKSK